MLDNITIAEVGSMVNVRGSRIATPFGPPRPGNTPTKMPSTSPTIIRASIFHVIRTAKPCSKRPKASMAIFLVTEGRFERALRHDNVEGYVEGDEHDRGEDECCQQRFPQRDLADHPHEAGDQEEARDVKSEILRRQAEQRRGHEHKHDAAQLRAGDEGIQWCAAREECGDQPIEAGAAENDRKIERKIPGLRA